MIVYVVGEHVDYEYDEVIGVCGDLRTAVGVALKRIADQRVDSWHEALTVVNIEASEWHVRIETSSQVVLTITEWDVEVTT